MNAGQFFGNIGGALGNAFLNPLNLHFLWFLPVIILLYLLKLRRTPVTVSSTLLWIKSLHDLTANAPFQRLRKNLLLLLQLLVAAGLALALARPFMESEGTAGRTICLLIDRSASMQTREGDETRLDQAKEAAVQLVDEMDRGDKMMLVTFGENSDVLSELTADRLRLRSLIRSITPSDGATKLADALMVAHSLKFSVEDLSVVVITDGNVADLDRLEPRNYELSFLRIGATSRNAGITAFSTREPEPGEDLQQTFILVSNAHTEPVSTTVSLYYEDQLMGVETVEAGPGADAEILFEHPALEEGVMRAELDVEDALEADNKAWLSVRPASMVDVLIVSEPDSPGAFFLKRALAPDSRVLLSTIAPADYASTDEYDLTIFDNCLPSGGGMPEGTLVFINEAPAIPGLSLTGEIESPPVIAADSSHPLMRYLNPENVGISKARRYELPPGARTLASTTGAPLIADITHDGQPMVLIAFDIADSDWPLRLSYPLFFQNLLAWVPESALQGGASTPAGRPFAVMPAQEATEARVIRPDNTTETITLDALRPVYYGNTEIAGIYAVERGGDTERRAVNLLDRVETDAAPRDALQIGREQVAAEPGTVRQKREIWRWLAGAALALLAVEWWIYSRRAWI